MLTTFNEVDMSEVIKMRKEYKDEFQKKYSVKLGFMSFRKGKHIRIESLSGCKR